MVLAYAAARLMGAMVAPLVWAFVAGFMRGGVVVLDDGFGAAAPAADDDDDDDDDDGDDAEDLWVGLGD